ncbi:unnamed protein product [Medioppia subpectinata]|uniref:RecA family profile 1 domain-containing protein n=1 Tax=Medioppia subpectinata TaxID=1979941 RepID=A0A7R9KH22_9ACAR|nr:unnamed protein product [Medioppia subpectinata]CAG2103227.1 unnamed protein product [Medioppia subpectinata]
MSLLLCEDMCEHITEDILKTLVSMKVKSVVDLIGYSLPKLRSDCRQSGLHFETLMDIRNELSERFGAKRVNAFDLYRKPLDDYRVHSFKTGIHELDQILTKGIRRGEVIQIEGNSGSGKTLFCYTLMASVVREFGYKVLYLDTDLGFSAPKVLEILRNRFPSLSDETIEEIMSEMDVLNVFDMPSLFDTIETIDYDLETNADSVFKDLSLLIVDSVSSLMSFALKKSVAIDEKRNRPKNRGFDSLALTTQMGQMLRALADKHSVAVVVTNDLMVAHKNSWNKFCDLCLHFEGQEVVENEPFFTTFTVTQTYDRSIATPIDNMVEISEIGMGSPVAVDCPPEPVVQNRSQRPDESQHDSAIDSD